MKNRLSENPTGGGYHTERSGNADLTRFIASLLIMGFHRFHIGIPAWGYNWAWVEYFFILSGYFAMAHMDMLGDIREPGKEAVRYTVHKFAAYLPYVVAAVLIRYVIEAYPFFIAGNIKGGLLVFAYMPFEDMYLSVSGILGGPDGKLAQIWYLSAMFITLPVICYLIGRCRDIWRFLAWIVPVLYYGQHGVNVVRGYPNDLYRAFCAMAIGSLCYMAVNKLREYEFKTWQKSLLTVIEVVLFLLSVWITCGAKSFINLLLLSFPISAILTLSQCTYTAHIKGRLWTLLARLSLPIYLFHWDVGIVLGKINMPTGKRYFLYYIVTIGVSLLAVVVVERVRKPFGQAMEKILPSQKIV